MTAVAHHWLPAGKTAAVCFSVDDIHPGTSRDAYEAGGELGRGALGRLVQLQRRHPQLKATLAVTPDWRLSALVPDRPVLRHIPWLNQHVQWTRLHPMGHFRVDRHPQFVAYLNGLERCEIVLHGLHHAHTGPQFAAEFQEESEEACADIVRRGWEIFASAGLNCVCGYIPPAWNAPRALLAALGQLGFDFVSSARDLQTPISPQAVTAMSGLRGVSLVYPELVGVGRRLVHFSCNFQATSSFERAVQILEVGGVLHVKAHIFKSGGGHTMADGLDEWYCDFLDRLFDTLAGRFGEGLWWAHLSEVAGRVRGLP
jgi:hypothetical protein